MDIHINILDSIPSILHLVATLLPFCYIHANNSCNIVKNIKFSPYFLLIFFAYIFAHFHIMSLYMQITLFSSQWVLELRILISAFILVLFFKFQISQSGGYCNTSNSKESFDSQSLIPDTHYNQDKHKKLCTEIHTPEMSQYIPSMSQNTPLKSVYMDLQSLVTCYFMKQSIFRGML